MKLDTEFIKRTLSAIVLVPIIVKIILMGGYYFDALVAVSCMIMAYEWIRMVGDSKIWLGFGLIYIIFPCYAAIFLEQKLGPMFFLKSITLVWISDIAAYIFGRLIGGPKIIPKVSPNKTWSGSISSLICCAIAGHFIFGSIQFSLMMAIAAQAGDFFESYLKRKFGVKDSGNLIPGHGGMLDRLDSILFVLIFLFFIYKF